jgi:Leucine-rich repeat (LRR) protein
MIRIYAPILLLLILCTHIHAYIHNDQVVTATVTDAPLDRYALKAIFAATNGPTHWLERVAYQWSGHSQPSTVNQDTEVSMCDWYGVTCSDISVHSSSSSPSVPSPSPSTNSSSDYRYNHRRDSNSLTVTVGHRRVTSLHLSQFGLVGYIPAEIGLLTELSELYLDSAYPASFHDSYHVNELPPYFADSDVRANILSYIDVNISACTQLARLSLAGTSLSALPTLPESLNALVLSELPHLYVPETFYNLALQQLTYTNAKLETVPKWITHGRCNTSLQLLTLDMNQLEQLPTDLFARLTRLFALSVNHNKLRSLPDMPPGSTTFQQLYAKHNQLTSLPQSLCEASLSAIVLNYNDITSLSPACVAFFQDLTILSVRGNALSTISLPASSVPQLSELDLSYNSLTYVDFPSFTHTLSKVQLTNNRLFASGKSLNFSVQTKLRILDVSSNRLDAPLIFPASCAVSVLTAANNRLASISDQITSCTNIQYLFVQDNKLASIPWSGGMMQVDATMNEITQVPPSLHTLCPNMFSLNMSHNLIQSFGTPLDVWDSMQFLNLSNNRITAFDVTDTGSIIVLDIAHNLLPTLELSLSTQVQFLFAHHNLLSTVSFKRIHEPYSPARFAGLRVLDLSFNKLYEHGSHGGFHSTELLTVLAASNVQLLNLGGNPMFGNGLFGLDLLTRTDTHCVGLKNLDGRRVDTGCWQFRPPSIENPNQIPSYFDGWAQFFEATDTDTQRPDWIKTFLNWVASSYTSASTVALSDIGTNGVPYLHCQELYYTGTQTWTGPLTHRSSFSLTPIAIDHGALQFRRCFIPLGSYPIYHQGMSSKTPAEYPIAVLQCPSVAWGINPCTADADSLMSRPQSELLPGMQSVYGFDCRSGYDSKSYMCSRCTDGYSKTNGQCRSCSGVYKFVMVIALAFAVIVVYTYVGISSFSSGQSAATILIFHAQMLAFLTATSIPTPHVVQQYFFGLMHWSTGDSAGFSCVFSRGANSFYSALQDMFWLPVIVLLAVTPTACAVWMLIERWQPAFCARLKKQRSIPSTHGSRLEEWSHELLSPHHDHQQIDSSGGMMSYQYANTARQLWWKWALFMLHTMYAPICLRIFQTFGVYRDAANASVPGRLIADLEVEYESAYWSSHLLPYALAGIIVYVLGIPLLMWCAIHSKLGNNARDGAQFLVVSFQHSQDDNRPSKAGISSALHMRSENTALVYMFIKATVALLIALISNQSRSPLLVILWILISLVVYIAHFRPYAFASDNNRALISLTILQMTYTASLVSLQATSDSASAHSNADSSFSSSTSAVLVIVAACLNLLYFVWLAVQFARDRRRNRQHDSLQNDNIATSTIPFEPI